MTLAWDLPHGQHPDMVLEIGRVAQSHLIGMSCQFKSTESKGPERKAEVGHQIQGEKIRIKTKPQPNKGCELD